MDALDFQAHFYTKEGAFVIWSGMIDFYNNNNAWYASTSVSHMYIGNKTKIGFHEDCVRVTVVSAIHFEKYQITGGNFRIPSALIARLNAGELPAKHSQARTARCRGGIRASASRMDQHFNRTTGTKMNNKRELPICSPKAATAESVSRINQTVPQGLSEASQSKFFVLP
ncbi:hypothetical protein RRG08_014291 [Elysia crispata]|uniref:Uncharacterized protein n=1 Tax=Elysia crispata TaxID=231223 RepID=A0AAE1B9E3_9GAST|nr:hypothetical protein RRG08_014291 [Elysia crispata]